MHAHQCAMTWVYLPPPLSYHISPLHHSNLAIYSPCTLRKYQKVGKATKKKKNPPRLFWIPVDRFENFVHPRGFLLTSTYACCHTPGKNTIHALQDVHITCAMTWVYLPPPLTVRRTLQLLVYPPTSMENPSLVHISLKGSLAFPLSPHKSAYYICSWP